MQFLERMWMEQGWHLTHGPGGWGYYGLPLPRGACRPTSTTTCAPAATPTAGALTPTTRCGGSPMAESIYRRLQREIAAIPECAEFVHTNRDASG